jgi:rod shape-determining protein MreD
VIKTIFTTTFISTIFQIIQTTWLKNGLFWGVIPDLSLLIILWVAYNNRASQGVMAGFLSGIVCDVLSSSPLGSSSFLYVVPAYAASLLRQVVVMDTFFIPVILGFSGTILKGLSSIILLTLFGSSQISAYSMSDIHFWIEATLNGAIAPLLFLGLARIRGILVTRKVTE